MKKLFSTLLLCTFLTVGIGTAEAAKTANHPKAGKRKAAARKAKPRKQQKRAQARRAARRANKAKVV